MTVASPTQPLADVVEEARRVISLAADAQIAVRLLGGAAFGEHHHSPVPERLRRTYGDIDIAVGRRDARGLPRFLVGIGYVADDRFNALHGEKRMLFRDPVHARKFDVFIGEFTMCHRLTLEGRLPATGSTLAPADLLLTKLQIVELNVKDTVDALGLLRDHEVGPAGQADAIDLARLAKVCGDDWGWYTTVSDNLGRLEVAAQSHLDEGDRDRVLDRLGQIHRAIDDSPKSRGWRLRARIGRRVEWFEIPDEVG
jgi:hypothetical protein